MRKSYTVCTASMLITKEQRSSPSLREEKADRWGTGELLTQSYTASQQWGEARSCQTKTSRIQYYSTTNIFIRVEKNYKEQSNLNQRCYSCNIELNYVKILWPDLDIDFIFMSHRVSRYKSSPSLKLHPKWRYFLIAIPFHMPVGFLLP